VLPQREQHIPSKRLSLATFQWSTRWKGTRLPITSRVSLKNRAPRDDYQILAGFTVHTYLQCQDQASDSDGPGQEDDAVPNYDETEAREPVHVNGDALSELNA
jgi:hypothetical protein